MPNVTSNLTLKLSDLLSKPAGEAAAALKKFGLTAQDLQKAAKLDQLKVVQADFQKVSLAVTNTSQTVKVLTERLAAAKNPTAQMQVALERAQRASAAAGQSFIQQSDALKLAQASLQSLGIPLSQIATEETRLKGAALAATTAMEQQASRAQSIGSRIRSGIGSAFGSIAPFVGMGMAAGAYKAVKAGAAVDSSETGLRAAGISASEIESVSSLIMKQQALHPELPINELLDRYKEERSITHSPAEAQAMLPVIAQTMAVLKTMGDGTTTGLGFMMKAAQGLGAAQNPARLTSFMEAFLKAKQVKGDLITAESMSSFFGGLKGSGALLSDRFLHTTAMSLAAELKSGGRAGSGIDQMIREIVAPSGEQAKEFAHLGLMDRSEFKPRAGGGFKSFGHGDINKLGEVKFGAHGTGWQVAQTDPDTWVKEYLLPAFIQSGFKDLPTQLSLVAKMFSGRSAEIVTKLITQAKEYDDEAERMREAHGGAATGDYATDAKFQLETLGTALYNFGTTLTKPAMAPAAGIMNSITRSIAGWSERISSWNKEHPTLAPFAGPSAVGALGAGGLVLSLGLLRSFLGFGSLKTSAGLLNVAAGNLNAATSKLLVGGGGAAVGAAEGAAMAGGGMIAKSLIKGILGGIATYAIAYQVESALYDALVPEKTKKEIKRRSDAIDDMKYNLMSKAELQRRAFNSDRQRQRIAPIGDFTLGSDRGFRLDAGPNLAGFDRAMDAQAAGVKFGAAFRQAVATELDGAVSDTHSTIDKIVGLMTFGASPNITPSAAGGGGGATGGLNTNGVHSDAGVSPAWP
jgi:hypothetical protein